MNLLILFVIGAVIVLITIILILLERRNTKHDDDSGLMERLAEFSQREEATLESIELSQPFTKRVIIPILRKLGIKIQQQEMKGKDTPEKKLLDSKKGFNISVACPRLLSKKFESIFLFQLFLPKEYATVRYNIKSEFKDQEISQHLSKSDLKKDKKITVRLFHPDFIFSDAVTKNIDNPLTKITFLGKPKDNCEPGTHKILISISDAETEQELESFTFAVNVVDFAFGKISRPLLSRLSAVVLGIGSFTMFILTLLEQIDKTVGLTSGTVAGVLTLAISSNLYNLYHRVRPVVP